MSFSNFSRTLRARLHLGRVSPAIYIGIAAVVIVAVAFTASSAMAALSAHTFEVNAAESADGTADAATDANAKGEAEPAPATIFVHVTGAVNAPGLYELAQGARVADAINAAGGFSENAATDSINLARPLNDGEQIIVNEQQQQPNIPSAPAAASDAAAANSAAPSAGASVAQSSSALININTATAEELETLDGVGPATAEKIIKDRTANGPFQTIDDLTRVSGIGEKKLEAIRDSICV